MRDLVARLNALQCDDGNLPVKPGIRLAGMIDEVRRLGLRDRGEIERLLDLHRVAPDLGRQLVKLVRADDAPAPNGNKLALLDHVPSKDGPAAGHVTILDFALIGKVSRRF